MKKKLTYVDVANLFVLFLFTYIQIVDNPFTEFCEKIHIKYFALLFVSIIDFVLISKNKKMYHQNNISINFSTLFAEHIIITIEKDKGTKMYKNSFIMNELNPFLICKKIVIIKIIVKKLKIFFAS